MDKKDRLVGFLTELGQIVSKAGLQSASVHDVPEFPPLSALPVSLPILGDKILSKMDLMISEQQKTNAYLAEMFNGDELETDK